MSEERGHLLEGRDSSQAKSRREEGDYNLHQGADSEYFSMPSHLAGSHYFPSTVRKSSVKQNYQYQDVP